MTKRIAAVAVALGLPLMLWADRGHTPVRVPLDVAWHFCSCGPAIYGHFHRAPAWTVERQDVTEWT